MATGVRVAVTLACTECKRRNYQSEKSKRNDPDRVESVSKAELARQQQEFCAKNYDPAVAAGDASATSGALLTYKAAEVTSRRLPSEYSAATL